MKRLLAILIGALVLGLVVFLLFIASQTNFFRYSDIKEINAAQFKDERNQELATFKEKGFTAWQEAKLYLVDIRSRQEYANGHIKGSISTPYDRAKTSIGRPDGVDIAIYTSASNYAQAREVAEAIVDKALKEQSEGSSNEGKIYVIKEGFEGLRDAGVEIEVAAWD